MAEIRSISEIYENLSNDLRNKLSLSDDNLKKVLDAVALSLAGEFKLTYLFLADIQNNLFPDTADTSENGGTLERQGNIYLNRNINPATSGTFDVSVTGEPGSVLRSGLTFKSNDNSLNPGNLYILDQEIVLVGNDIVEIRSLDGGVEQLLEPLDTLTITEPVIGVDKVVSVDSVVSQPLAAESVEDYRISILQAIQLEPQGGAKTDYRIWSADAQGVRFVYPYVKDGEAGTVQVYVEATEEDSTDGNGTPSAALLTDVEEVIEFDPDETLETNSRGRRPIQATVEVLPVTPVPVDVIITDLQQTSVDIENAITENLKEFLTSIRPFVSGADLARNKNDILYSAKLQSVVTDVIDSSNFFTDFDVMVQGVSQQSFLFSRENIPYLRDLTIN